MRTAPPADYPVSREGPWHQLGLGLLMLAAAGVAAWAANHLHLSASVLALCAICGVCLLAWRGRLARVQPSLRLRWDGQSWRLVTVEGLHADGPSGSVRVIVDVGNGLLLRWAEPGGRRARVLPLWRARDQVPAWHALRVAVHAGRQAS